MVDNSISIELLFLVFLRISIGGIFWKYNNAEKIPLGDQEEANNSQTSKHYVTNVFTAWYCVCIPACLLMLLTVFIMYNFYGVICISRFDVKFHSWEERRKNVEEEENKREVSEHGCIFWVHIRGVKIDQV